MGWPPSPLGRRRASLLVHLGRESKREVVDKQKKRRQKSERVGKEGKQVEGKRQQDLKLKLNRFKHRRNTDVYINFFKGALLDFE